MTERVDEAGAIGLDRWRDLWLLLRLILRRDRRLLTLRRAGDEHERGGHAHARHHLLAQHSVC